MLLAIFTGLATFIGMYSLFLVIAYVSDEEDALIVTVLLSLTVGLLMCHFISPWGIF